MKITKKINNRQIVAFFDNDRDIKNNTITIIYNETDFERIKQTEYDCNTYLENYEITKTYFENSDFCELHDLIFGNYKESYQLESQNEEDLKYYLEVRTKSPNENYTNTEIQKMFNTFKKILS